MARVSPPDYFRTNATAPVQVILQQLPQQLPTIDLQPRLHWWRIAGS
jgi:hypothetical protein